MNFQRQLEAIIRSDAWFLSLLQAARDIELPDWAIGAGVVRNLVWDHLHGYRAHTPANDVDLVYFDPVDLERERERAAEEILARVMPGIPWQVKNQARVHLWYERVFGQSVPPLHSVEEAVATWPETATAIAVRLLRDDTLAVIAPYGLDDLFEMILRRNPARVTREEFLRRAHDKAILTKWPNVRLVDE